MNNQLQGCYLKALKVGMSAYYPEANTETDVALVAVISGNDNATHVSEELVNQPRF